MSTGQTPADRQTPSRIDLRQGHKAAAQADRTARPAMTEMMVVVQRAWTDWQTATVRVEDLDDIHWFQPVGAPRPLLHANVRCTDLVSGNIPHNCNEATAHVLSVCVLKSHTPAALYDRLTQRADQHGKPYTPVLPHPLPQRVPVRSYLNRVRV